MRKSAENIRAKLKARLERLHPDPSHPEGMLHGLISDLEQYFAAIEAKLKDLEAEEPERGKSKPK